ncbi:MAG: N-acetyltransferase [Cyanobacteriota bacterium]|nr:N-acetyltransferase [Cyanobacteriota bacterium]
MLLPFRGPPSSPLHAGYELLVQPSLQVTALNQLLESCGETPRSAALWGRVLHQSIWHLVVRNPQGSWVGFVRATSDRALNANLWDLLTVPSDPARDTVIRGLVMAALDRLRRELSGCSISISAPAEAIAVLQQAGFVIDPGGIRAMGLVLSTRLQTPQAGDLQRGGSQAPVADPTP